VASPVGHGLIGLAVGSLATSGKPPRDHHRAAALCAVLAISPDFDFLPGILVGQPALYHQGVSHSLGFAGAVGLLGAAVLRPAGWKEFTRLWVACAAAYASHMFVDLFSPDERPPYGVPLFWPFADGYWLSPVPLLPGIRHSASTATPTGEWLASVFSWTNVRAIGVELMVASPLLLLAALRRRRSWGGLS
jgi:membrane-bound metal-dependent hydrolase YbcI (DUF457 family)